MSKASDDVLAERQRQIEVEGWTPGHDDFHTGRQLAIAGACYALNGVRPMQSDDNGVPLMWPWDDEWWKPRDRRRNLVRAAALLVAEIERLDRLSSSVSNPNQG
jgi:hypothetical protein